MTYTEKLMVCALVASMVGAMWQPIATTWREISTRQAPVVQRYESVYGRVRRMAETIGE